MKYYEDKSDRKMELKLLSLSEDDKLIRECMEQASAFYGCLGKMGVTEILCDRKKAQELGADCQITGIFTGGELTAFACAFEYTGLKRNGRKWLNPGDKEWRQIETLGTNVVVIPLLVGKEKVGRLIELLREQYRDSHLLFRISGEQSEKFQEDLAVVSEKNLKSHRYDAAGENVWLFHFAPQIRMEDTYFEEEILLILPGQEVLLEMGIEEAEVTMVKLTGYEIVRSEKGSAFFRKPGAACEGVLLQCDYEQLLRYQRFINLTNYEEHFEQTDRGKALIYSEKYQSDSSLLWNDLLREMVKTRKAEWSIVPDSYIMYPVTYKEQDRLLECACYDNQEIGNYMHYMDIRLQCETGVPFGKDGIDLMERYKNRLERIPLGRLRVRITLEMILDILDHEDQPVGCDAEAEAVLSIDRLSHIGVLTLVSLSTPFLLSHFLDNIVRNQLMVIEENGEAVNLYAYMQEKWGLNASGTPKSYEMIPKEKNCLNKKQLGAVLLSETIYEEGEDFGEFTDAEILKLTNSETGMGQYSRAFVVAHTNVLLDFEKDLRGTIQARMYNAAFTCFYVELLMFEEAALTCFNKELIDLMAEVMRIEPTEFLTRARTITNRYLNTVDFWNVSVNYPSSQKSLQMIRKSFLIDDLKEKMEYNQKQVGNIFDINREIVDRQEAKEEKERDDQSNTALTILSVLCFFSAMIDGNDYLSTLDWLIPAGVLDIILKGVFAAMMNYESGDVMKVFPMHDITTDGNTGSATKSSMEIRGKDDIAQIHNMYTPKPGGTPYTQVNNAAGELTKLLNAGSVDEGWLVVLTDGDFDNDIPASGLKADLEGKAAANENLYVQYLAIGTDVKNIPEGNADKGLYAQKAGNTSEVVNELAEISNRIFKRNEYAGYSSEDSGLEFDIPLRKLIVFAQGKDVKIGSLKNEEGGEVKLQSDTAVSYSSTDGAGLTTFVKSTPVKDTSLKGQVAVFADESPIVAGNYTLDVSGADSIQIYYEPDVKFEAGLYKGDTKMEEGTIEGGAYTVKVGFVDQLSGKYIKSSKLLGEPKYTVSINGETQELTGKDGASQSIDVEVDGESLELTADVNYLKDYTDSASYTFKVCTLDINVDAFKSANLKTLEDGANQITVEATRNDQPLTKEQWDAATLDVVSVNKDGEEFGIQWDVQKGSEVSTWIVTPKYKKGGMFATETGQADVTINVSAEIDGDGYGKAETVSVNIKDDKNIVDYLKRYWKHIVISLLLLILILGYVPPFKKRFARSIKKRPSIECSAEKIGLRDNVMKGNFEKDLASRLLPYVPETGRLTFSPTPVKKTAKVRASGGGSMLILNTSAFAGKEEITFNGMSIQENEKGHHRISASTIIVVSTPEFTYTCIPNVQRTANGEIKRGKRK